MRNQVTGWSAMLVVMLVAAACGQSTNALQDAQRGFVSLPEGDVDAGRSAFERVRCYSCHDVKGEKFPPPTTDIPTGVTLGTAWDREWSAQEIATAILDPSHDISDAYEEGVVKSGTLSRMGQNRHIQVGELLDIVAFLRKVNRDALASTGR